MTLAFQTSQFPFRFGLSEGVEPHQAPPGTLMTAENVAWQKAGRLQKRQGTSVLVATIIGGGSIAAASRLFCRGSELCLVDGTSLYAYSSTFASWRNVGKVPNVGITSTTLVDSVSGVAACDTAISAGALRVDAWVTGVGSANALFVQVSDASGSLLVQPTQVVAGSAICSSARVLIIGTTAIVLTHSTATTAITAVTINLSTLAVSASSALRSDVHASLIGWDACVIGSTFVISYTNTTPLLKLYSYNTSLVQQATGGITTEILGAESVSIDGASGESLYVLYVQGQSAGPRYLVNIATANPSTLAEVVAPVTVETPDVGAFPSHVAVCRYDATNCIAAYRSGLTVSRVTTYKIASTGVVATTSERGTYGTHVLSRPFMLGGSCYMLIGEGPVGLGATAVYDASTNLVEVETSARTTAYTPHRYIGCVDVLIGGNFSSSEGVPPGVAVSSSTSVYVPVPFQSTSGTDTSVVRQGLRLVNLTIGASRPADMWRTVPAGQETIIESGLLSTYDGRSAFDYGFPRGPAFYSLTPSNGAGSIALGTYLYGGVYEYRSAAGRLYRSPARTEGGTVTLAGAEDTVTVTSSAFNLGNKQTLTTGFYTDTAIPTLNAWYRSTVGGSSYYRLTIEPSYSVSYVDQLDETLVFTDLSLDTSISGSGLDLDARPVIYTAGGILDDYAPPGGVTLSTHADRLWVLANDQKTWWYSKQFQDDLGVAPGFHPNFRISFAETQTAMATMDDKAIFFSDPGVKYMLGTGPAPNGLNSDFQTPTSIQTDVGCTNARSVVGTPDGVMFLSARGIYLLDRGMTISWIGRAIKDKLALFPNITSAVLVAKKNQVRFTCNATDGLTGIVLVYDYVEKQWSVSKYRAAVASTPIADACMWNGAWTYVTPTGIVYTESEATYLDNGSYVAMTLETAWVCADGPLSYKSVRSFTLNGTSYTDHDLTITVGFDSNTTYQQTATFLGTSAVTAVGDLEECTVIINTRRKCGSIRFKITDATPTTGTVGTGQGPSFDMMGIEVGMKRGIASSPATKRA